MTYVHVLRVFTDEDGNFGDTATVVFDEDREIADVDRQEIAQRLDAVETVFVNNIATYQISFMHSQGEIDFAGVPALGAAWLLAQREGKPISQLLGRSGKISVSQQQGLTWVHASLTTMPQWNHVQYPDADAVERISLSETKDWEHTMVWAWINEEKGSIRARTFAPDWDIPEAMGNGSGSLLLASQLNQAIEIHHGEGSVIYAKPADNGYGDLGGRVSESSLVVI